MILMFSITFFIPFHILQFQNFCFVVNDFCLLAKLIFLIFSCFLELSVFSYSHWASLNCLFNIFVVVVVGQLLDSFEIGYWKFIVFLWWCHVFLILHFPWSFILLYLKKQSPLSVFTNRISERNTICFSKYHPC